MKILDTIVAFLGSFKTRSTGQCQTVDCKKEGVTVPLRRFTSIPGGPNPLKITIPMFTGRCPRCNVALQVPLKI